MKHAIIPEQHWIHEPDCAQLKSSLVKRDRLIVVLLVVAMTGWACLGLSVLVTR